MQTLWRTTASILRNYPILWLPLVAADLVSFGLSWTERRLHHDLILHLVSWLSQSHSVLSSTPVYADPPPYTASVIAILTAPITWVTYFASTVLYTSAMLVTASILANLADNGQPRPRSAALALSSSRRRILLFSLKLCAIFVLSLPVMGLLFAVAFEFQRFLETTAFLPLKLQLQLQHADLFGYLTELPILMAIAYMVAPIALKLLQPPGAIPTPQARKAARIATLIVVAVTSTLEIFLPRVVTTFLQQLNPAPPLVVYIVRTLTSLIAAVPYVLLYIALYLIATPDSPLAIPPPANTEPVDLAGDDIPE